MSWTSRISLAFIALSVGCFTDVLPADNCVAGETTTCPCADGSQSTQTCSDNGDGFGACACEGESETGGDGDGDNSCADQPEPCFGCTIPGASNFDPDADVNDGSCVCTPASGEVADQVQLASSVGTGGLDQWQSFTVELGGALSSLELGVDSPLGDTEGSGTITIYEGEGVDGTPLGSTDVNYAAGISQAQVFMFDPPIPLTPGGVYSYRLEADQMNIGWVQAENGDVYAGGRSSYDADTDLVFKTLMVQCE